MDILSNETSTLYLGAHAKLYHFADYNMIIDLKSLCRHKWHRDLLVFNLSSETIPFITELLRFTYDITETDESYNDNSLRSLVMAYATSLAKELMEYDELNVLLTEGGDLVRDFMTGVAKRLT